MVRTAPLPVPRLLLWVGATETLPPLQGWFGLMMEVKLGLTFGFSSAAFGNHRKKKGMVLFRIAMNQLEVKIWD